MTASPQRKSQEINGYTPYQNQQKPRNPSNEAIVEIRAGAGGDEAALLLQLF